MPAPKQPWPDEVIERMRVMRAEGKSVEEIAEALGRNYHTVRDKIGKLHLPLSPASPQHRYFGRRAATRPQRAGKTTLPPLESLE